MFKPKMGIQLYTLRDYIKNKEEEDRKKVLFIYLIFYFI